MTLIVNVELNSIMGYPQMDEKLLRLYKGHVYFNLNILKRKVEYEIPVFLRNDDVLNYFPQGSGPYGKQTMKKLPFELKKRLIAELRVMLHDGAGSITRTAKAYENWTYEEFYPFCEQFDDRILTIRNHGTISSFIELANPLNRCMLTHFRLVRYGIPVHNIGMNLLAQYLLARFIGKKTAARTYPVLISGLKDKTSEINTRIRQLASIIRENPKLKTIILEKDSNELYEYLSTKQHEDFSEAFFQAFSQFMELFGDRGFTREPYYPRWYEAPRYIFDILKSLVMDTEQDPQVLEARSRAYRQKIESYVYYKVISQRFGFLKWKFFSIILGLARKYIIFRELQRFNLDRWISRNRQIYLEIGQHFFQQKILQNASDIFFLRKKEINKLISRAYTAEEVVKITSLVKNRRAEFLRFEHTTPPKFLCGSRSFNDPDSFTSADRFFRGIPASSGVITAPVRVLKTIEQIPQVRAGEVIVVPRTDPGWTPIFSKIGGLITETGGILSHGAVVSREYAIPAVTNIRNACQIFKTGQTVTIDGNRGSVKIETKE